jgi:hypothetical protein
MSVIILGSSGGGAATLGHTDPPHLLKTIHEQLGIISSSQTGDEVSSSSGVQREGFSRRCHGVLYALFVACEVPMDSADPDTDSATLWTVGLDRRFFDIKTSFGEQASKKYASRVLQVQPYFTGTLSQVNQKVKEVEEKVIVPEIVSQHSHVKGIICISCDPGVVNYASLSAASKMKLPVTGSGGTSLSAAIKIHKGLSLVGNAGGSVATTTYTRAVSYCCALSLAWKESYNPFQYDSTRAKPKLKSILESCLPSFLAVCFTCRVLEVLECWIRQNENGVISYFLRDILLGETSKRFVDQLRNQALPTVCSVVAAISLASNHGPIVIMASVVASMSCWGSVLSGLLTGWFVSAVVSFKCSKDIPTFLAQLKSHWCWIHLLTNVSFCSSFAYKMDRCLFMCIKSGVPATMTNILVAGFVGPIVALLVHSIGLVTILSSVTTIIRLLVRTTPAWSPWDGTGYGFVLGCLFCYGSKIGWYHSIFLPIILVEMEHGETSLWGSVDQCALVLVSAGVCAANCTMTRDHLPRRGLKINLCCGDFIEVAYPYMEDSILVNLSAYLASGVATEILYQTKPTISVMTSAYFPLPLSIFLAEDNWRISIAMLSAFFIAFLGTLTSRILSTLIEKKRNIINVTAHYFKQFQYYPIVCRLWWSISSFSPLL